MKHKTARNESELRLHDKPGVSGRDVTRYLQTTVKKLLPESAFQELQRYRQCDQPERRLYLKIRALNAVGLMNSGKERPPITALSFLFVCFGNIMRSPMCEALMKRVLTSSPFRDVVVSSAGLHAVPGRSAHPWAITAAREFGVSLEGHHARLLTGTIVDQSDAIFVMDYQNLAQLLSRYPDARTKIFMMTSFAGKEYSSSEIYDPYYLGEEKTRECYRVLSQCIQNLVRRRFDKN